MWSIDNYRLITISGTVPSVRLSLKHGDEVVTVDVNAGDGPFDALFWAIEQITGINVVCRNFNVHSVTVGTDAQGEVTVEVEHGGHLFRGRGVSTDSILASAKAFLNAINRIIATEGRPTTRISPFENRAPLAAAQATNANQ